MLKLVPEVDYVHLFINNASTDGMQEELRRLVAESVGQGTEDPPTPRRLRRGKRRAKGEGRDLRPET